MTGLLTCGCEEGPEEVEWAESMEDAKRERERRAENGGGMRAVRVRMEQRLIIGM